MRWTVLSDNRSDDSRLSTEHGLSIFLRRSQTGRHKILLDTGASDVFIRNADQLGIDLSDVDYVFISHGHSDHAGGLRYFMEHHQKAQVIVSPDAMSGKFYSKRGNLHSITTEWPEISEDRLVLIDQTCEILEGLHVIAHIPQTHPMPKGNRNLYVQEISMFRMPTAIISTMTSATNWHCMLMVCYSRAVLIADWRIFCLHVLGQFIPL